MGPQFFIMKGYKMGFAIKYAPKSLAEVIFPNQAVKLRVEAYTRGLLDKHIILHGPNGTGKSTIARLLPDAIVGGNAIVECNDYDDLLNKKDLRQYLRQACTLNGFTDQSKVFLVFEEFDNAKVNLNKLWTAMDACANELLVIISTNHEMSISKSFRDRCNLINIHKLSANNILPRAQFILQNEGLILPDDYVLAYLQQADWSGSLRLYMQMLDELYACHAMGLPLPVAHIPNAANQPNFQIVSGGSK